MNKYEQIDYAELEELSVVGGADGVGAGTDTNSAVVASVAITTVEITNLVSVISGATIAWSMLFSCTKNKVTCKRK